MKTQYVPLEKRSKREKKEYHITKRGSWGDVNPVTRKTQNQKVYNRKKSERRFEHEPHSDSSLSDLVFLTFLAAQPWNTIAYAQICVKPDVVFNDLDKNYTYMFELTSPYNRIVVSYKDISIRHIGTRDISTLLECDKVEFILTH